MQTDDAPSLGPEPGRRGFWSEVKGALAGSEEHDYTRGSLRRAIWLLAIPMMLELLMESVFAVCDIFFVSRLGDDAVAAVGCHGGDAHDRLRAGHRVGDVGDGVGRAARRREEQSKGPCGRATAAIAVGVLSGIVLGAAGVHLRGGAPAADGRAGERSIETGAGVRAA